MQIKSRRIRRTGHVARVREKRELQSYGGESPKERDNSEDRGVDGRMRLEWMSVRLVGGVRSGFGWLATGTGAGLL
jgi:hypothetical protein